MRVAIVVALMFAPQMAQSSQPCRSVGDLRLPSPDGRRELILYSRVCGEQVTGEVEIAAKGRPVPDRSGNVDVPGHPLRTSARWTSNDAVVVEIPGAGAPPKPLKVDGVTVTISRHHTHLPITIEVKQDVQVLVGFVPKEVRGKLYMYETSGTTETPFVIRPGQRFEMVKDDEGEGQCRIAFQGRTHELTSCPWLDGFSDHQADIFHVVRDPNDPSHRPVRDDFTL